jgi:hypothetical protein
MAVQLVYTFQNVEHIYKADAVKAAREAGFTSGVPVVDDDWNIIGWFATAEDGRFEVLKEERRPIIKEV